MTQPNYTELVKFLLRPFVGKLDALKVDCETFRKNQRVWIRLALDDEDKGRILGRGGRNLQTIRTALSTAGSQVNQLVFLEIYTKESSTSGSTPLRRRRSSARGDSSRRVRTRGVNLPPNYS